jgi:hypothetical protein
MDFPPPSATADDFSAKTARKPSSPDRQRGTVQFIRWNAVERLDELLLRNFQAVLSRAVDDHLAKQGPTRDGGAAAVGLEHGVLDDSIANPEQ